MATEGQINALSNWLKVTVKPELDFEMASSALARLHEASEKYNEDKKANKGIVAATKRTIIKELRQAGYIKSQSLHIVDTIKEGPTVPTPAKEEETTNDITGPGDAGVDYDEAGFIVGPELQKHEKAIINEVVIKLSACTLAAKQLMESDYQDLTLTDKDKGSIRHAIAATILIQATRGGL